MPKLPAHRRITINREVVLIQSCVDIATWHYIASYSCPNRLCYLKHLWVWLLYTAWLPYLNVMEKAHKNEDSHFRHSLPYSFTSNFATAEVMKFFLYFASIFQIPYLQKINNQIVFLKLKNRYWKWKSCYLTRTHVNNHVEELGTDFLHVYNAFLRRFYCLFET